MYDCRRCGYGFSTKQNLISHYNRKQACKVTLEDVSTDICLLDIYKVSDNQHVYNCEYCNKKFKYPQGRSRHMKTCQNMPDVLANFNERIAKLEQQNKSPGIVINNTIGTLNNGIITLKNFGSENMQHISKDFLNSCLLMNSIVPLIETIHFDNEHPENHNVKVKSTKQELMETFVDGKWIITDTDDTLNELINKGYRVLNYHSRKNKNDIINNEMDEGEYEDVMSWLEQIYEDKKTRKPIKKQLLLLFINNKTMLLAKD